MALTTNAILKNQYRIKRFVGDGPSGFVYQGRDLESGRIIRIKQLRASFVRKPAAFERLLHPMIAANETQTPCLTTLYAYFQEDGRFVIVSEWIDGTALSAVRDDAEIPPTAKPDLLENGLAALAQLHVQGIVHGNLKPTNILVHPDRSLKFSDLGLAVVDGEFLAPERSAGGEADARSDVYELGVSMALGLYIPHSAQTPLKNHEIAAALASFVPPPLAQVLRTALEPDPQNRFADALVFQAAYLDASAGLSHHTSPPSIPSSPSPVTGAQADARAPLVHAAANADPPAAQRELPRHAARSAFPIRRAAIFAAILVLLAVGGIAVWGSNGIFKNPFASRQTAQNPPPIIQPVLAEPNAAPLTTPSADVTRLPPPSPPTRIVTPVPTPLAIATEIPAPVPTETLLDLGQLTPGVKASACAFDLQAGAYVVRSRQDRLICTAVLPQTYTNVRVNARFRMIKGDGIGSGNTLLIFGYQSAQDFFGISFTRIGRLYGVAQWQNDVPKSVVFYNWAEPLAQPDQDGATTNQVSFEVKDKQLYLWANGSLINVFSLQDFDYHGGQVGLGVYTSDSTTITQGGESALEGISIQPLP